MKNIKIFFIFLLILLYSCGQQFKEVLPESNENGIKIKLEFYPEKYQNTPRIPFSVKLINTGDRDVARCTLKFDDKYEHQLEGLINKSEDWEGKIRYSMLKASESVTIVFSQDIDNYAIFGINDANFSIPKTIELDCLDGKIIWKIHQ